ncbi:hypothetical protein DRO53_00420 [Candidatus Bathyarchaeota archaeon]|nr:MAG: hypothetical protein DRO53_00420 [Candidatus Bathyarchaeota archaeon]
MIKIERVEWSPENLQSVVVTFRYTIERNGETVEEVSSLEVPLTGNVKQVIVERVKAEVFRRRSQELFSQAKTLEGREIED